MSSKDDFSDDYVARLLAEDAKKTSAKYASQGLSALLPKKRVNDGPKPNTRFLSHIVREADSHNAALKRKEEAEADRRLKALRDSEERPAKRRRADESDTSRRRRMLGDILGTVRPEKRDGTRRSNGDTEKDKRRDYESHRHRSSKKLDKDESRSRRRRSRSRSPAERRRHLRRRDSSSTDGDHERNSKQTLRVTEDLSKRHKSKGQTPIFPKRESEEVRIRGRGAHKHRSAMDEHFREGYDPAEDVAMNSDHDSDAEDWVLALEAMRDRAKYKQSQAGRLRDAGFSEADIKKWEKGLLNKDDDDGDISTVKWTQKGQVREWDAGK